MVPEKSGKQNFLFGCHKNKGCVWTFCSMFQSKTIQYYRSVFSMYIYTSLFDFVISINFFYSYFVSSWKTI